MKPYTVYAVEGKPGGRWKRALLWGTVALLLILVAGAGGSYLWFRSQVAASNERVDPAVISVLSSKPTSTLVAVAAEDPEEPAPEPDDPDVMNILVLGSDRRADDDGEKFGRSDTIILVRIDPHKDYLGILSLPRDLRVAVPGYGREKINAAFALGGPALTIQTVEDLTGVDINHYVEVDFQAFKDITDALGGVYVDVDRRYYNDDPQWELIKLAPGYQLLHGADALDYVRFRHDLNADFGRMLRQQRFLSAMREQAMGWDLTFKLPRLISALFHNISTDLQANDFISLAYWGVRLSGDRIRQVSLEAATDTIDGISYVIASERELANAVAAFLSVPGSDTDEEPSTTTASSVSATSSTSGVDAAPDLEGVEVEVLNGNGRGGEAAKAKAWLDELGAEVPSVGNAGSGIRQTTVVLYPREKKDAAAAVARALGTTKTEASDSVGRVTVVLGLDFAIPTSFSPPAAIDTIPNASEWKALATMIDFPLQAPAHIPEGYAYYDRMPPEGATYDIEVGGGTKPALRMIYRLTKDGGKTDQYMGITATTWLDAPAASPGQEVEVDGVTFTIVGSSQKVDHIWWKADGVLYWVSNTLSYLLDKQEMLAVATSMMPVPRP